MKKQTRNKTISKFKSAVAGIIFPCRCPYCHIVIRRDEYACKKCADKLPKIVYHRFAIGGAPCASPLPYLNEYANAVKRFKFSGKGYLAQAFSFLIAKAVRESYGEYSFDFITCGRDALHLHTVNSSYEQNLNIGALCFQGVCNGNGREYMTSCTTSANDNF